MELHEEAALVTLWLARITALIISAMYYFNYQKAWAKWGNILLFARPTCGNTYATTAPIVVKFL
jgi:hypothetical protein